MKVVITRKILPIALEMLEAAGHQCLVWEEQLPPSKEELEQLCHDADGILSMLSDPFDSGLLAKCKKLKVISNYAVGFNNIDTTHCKSRQIKVGNTPDVLTESTAELAIALTLATTRNIVRSHLETKQGHWKTWEPMGYLGVSLEGKTLGIFGMGRIGFCYAKKMQQAFGMNVLYTNRNSNPEYEKEIGAKWVGLDELLASSDILSLHSPLTDETRNLFDLPKFQKMKKGSYLINTSRGELVDQDALVNVLKQGHLRGAGLDVTTPEPLPLNHELQTLSNVVLIPHIGSATDESRAAMARLAAQNIINALRGESMPAQIV